VFPGIDPEIGADRAAGRVFAARPGHAGVDGTDPDREEHVMAAALVRPRQRVIAGVCAGLARRFGMSPTTVRVLFVLSCILPGPQFLIYIVLWILMPSEK
jgi:phage shock protein PspC (stress-responsive transcriptional regulator)